MSIRTYDGAVVVITGGASGIGRSAGAELARRGAEVVLADVQAFVAEEAAHEITKAGGKATAVKVDVRDFAAVDRLFDDVVARTGRLDYVFNNAGVGVFGEVHLQEKEDWDLVFDVNLRGSTNVIRAAYPKMIAQGFGHLVNTASTAGMISSPFVASYVATKHAILGLSKSLRIEAARFGVRVSVLCPGVIRTPMLTTGAVGRSVYDISPERMISWWEQMGISELEPFTKDMLDELAKNKAQIILPKKGRLFLKVLRSFTGFELVMSELLYRRTLKTYPEIAAGRKKVEASGADLKVRSA